MTKNNFNFTIPITNHPEPFKIPLDEGKALFVLGANGVGKSALMFNLYSQNSNHSKRILAHRQTWFEEDSMNMSSSEKRQTDQSIKDYNTSPQSRWRDSFTRQRPHISIFDLINSVNLRARKISEAVDGKNLSLATNLSAEKSPIHEINEILKISNIPIVISLGGDERLFASKNGGQPYSVTELSDGERNTLLICSDVLTAEPNQLIIIDEPERHLHRSIISPLLTTLFQKRNDCVFVISTHEINLPIDHPESSILLLRSCNWMNKNIKNWDVDLISKPDDIPNFIKREILGSKRNILFVEGDEKSLDKQIYELIYPNITVIPQGNCNLVEKAVKGIRQTENLHWINAFGLIDKDDRTDDQTQDLLENGIVSLEGFSVEFLYYNLSIIKRVAQRLFQITGNDATVLYEKSTSSIIVNIKKQKERLCARLCEKYVRNQLMSQLPSHQVILQEENFGLKLDLKDILEKEKNIFDKFIIEKNIDGLIARYPIRETSVLNGIVSELGISRSDYERAVRKLIIDNPGVQSFYRTLLSNLTNLIFGNDKTRV